MRHVLAALSLVGILFWVPANAEAQELQDTTSYSARGADAFAAAHFGGRPAGCPRRYCGCASAKYLGIPNPGGILNLAANWPGLFPRTSPAPRMAAARRGHVFVILAVHGPGQVLAYDPNSGGGKTRVHVRSLKGFTVVNPHVRYAVAQ